MARWEVEVASNRPDLDPALAADIARAVRLVLAAEGAGDAEISVALLGDPAMARLHQEYLGQDGPTDVITFPLQAPGGGMVGDIYIGVEQADRQAAEVGVSFREEVLRLAIHATLHLLGWDHPEDGDRAASPMYLRQEKLLRSVQADQPS